MLNSVKIKDVKLITGELIKTVRKQHQLTQSQLAEALDISRLTVQNVEKGKNYTIDTLLKIVQYFDLLQELHELLLQVLEDKKQTKSLY